MTPNVPSCETGVKKVSRGPKRSKVAHTLPRAQKGLFVGIVPERRRAKLSVPFQRFGMVLAVLDITTVPSTLIGIQ